MTSLSHTHLAKVSTRRPTQPPWNPIFNKPWSSVCFRRRTSPHRTPPPWNFSVLQAVAVSGISCGSLISAPLWRLPQPQLPFLGTRQATIQHHLLTARWGMSAAQGEHHRPLHTSALYSITLEDGRALDTNTLQHRHVLQLLKPLLCFPLGRHHKHVCSITLQFCNDLGHHAVRWIGPQESLITKCP